ncbi:MAG TPA: tryptophan-rich sensory protein [Candidatus Stackebrandtia faecavium]|nr:tryptophan-rich sensory protein [Candidatus Stackebrandtia faecavium]
METRARMDLLRQIMVISAAIFMAIAAMVGTGLLGGTPVQELQGGALDTDGSFLAPASRAFSIWTAIYLGLFAYTVWQALPGQRARERHRFVGWWVAVSMVLNGLWLVTAQFLTLPLTVVSIIVLLAVLGVTFRRTTAIPARSWLDKGLLDGVTGLHLGWVTVATVANVSAWLTDIDFAPGTPPGRIFEHFSASRSCA